MRLRSASRDGDGDLDLGGELPPSPPQQAASGGRWAMGENSPLTKPSGSASLPLSDARSAKSLPFASRPSSPLAFIVPLATGDTECRSLFLDVGRPLPALDSVGLLFLGASEEPLSPHPYSPSSFADGSDLLAFKGDGDGL